MREFESGATRDDADEKLDFEGFLHPLVLERYGEYMHVHRHQADGNLRASDNWQKGIPRDAYMKSAWRHFMDWWAMHRYGVDCPPAEDKLQETLCALMFNVMGYLFEELKAEMDWTPPRCGQCKRFVTPCNQCAASVPLYPKGWIYRPGCECAYCKAMEEERKPRTAMEEERKPRTTEAL
jgi:hypothetical protein